MCTGRVVMFCSFVSFAQCIVSATRRKGFNPSFYFQHQVQHSAHPEHLDKNFAFMFPVWDVIFKTCHMSEDDRDVNFGIGDGNSEELTSCIRLYWRHPVPSDFGRVDVDCGFNPPASTCAPAGLANSHGIA